MSDSYLQFSEKLYLQNKKHKAWFEENLVACDPDKDHAKNPLKPLYDTLGEEEFPCFAWEMEEDGLWVYSEENAMVHHIALVVQEFFKAFSLHNRSFSVPWALTCSRPVLSEFGGGAFFVTSKKIEYFDTSNWVCKKAESFRKGLKK
jgi:hypothetical protein